MSDESKGAAAPPQDAAPQEGGGGGPPKDKGLHHHVVPTERCGALNVYIQVREKTSKVVTIIFDKFTNES